MGRYNIMFSFSAGDDVNGVHLTRKVDLPPLSWTTLVD